MTAFRDHPGALFPGGQSPPLLEHAGQSDHLLRRPRRHLRRIRPLPRPGDRRRAALFDLALRYGVRLADFQHFGRQNFGVLQLFKMRSGCSFPGWMKQAENAYFSGMTLLLFVTFLTGGRFRPDRPSVTVTSVVVVALFAWVLAGYAVALCRSRSRAALLPPLAYLLLQTCSAGLAVYSTRLYAFGAGHALRRISRPDGAPLLPHPLEASSRADRLYGRLRRHSCSSTAWSCSWPCRSPGSPGSG